ncbi:MAG TPA: NADH-quinone oxidoreductase subunit NuoF [Anaerolineales bacterium]|nr:NADH-quinone oxidoreductase subunit NuoF [Anaerolineales bacterium]
MSRERTTAVNELDERRREIQANQDQSQVRVKVCGGTGCLALSSDEVAHVFEMELKAQGVEGKVELKTTGCPGFCEQGPLVMIDPQRILYTHVNPKDVPEIVSQTVLDNNIIDRLLYQDPLTGEKITYETDVPFYKEQKRILLKNSGLIDPRKIEDYIAAGGYKALEHALFEMTPEEVIGEVKRSGLRGRGGAGFTTGVKWELCQREKAEPKYIICNADEGDPGAFQDRGLIEGNPHSVLEGLIIGAYAIGAQQGFIYIRNEYPLAVELIRLAAQQAKEKGLLGENILDSGFSFDVVIQLGAGAFVCGEETALIASIEGRIGEPRARPPYPAESGLWGKPTNINNVKTWAWVPHIINNGSEWFSQMGTEKSKGTTIFSVVGKIRNTGLVEVPMGISLRHLIEDIGGGASNGKKLKAVQTGGPSGGCIPENLWHLPVDYDSLRDAGSIMGSGGMIVMDETTCMVDIAQYFLKFTRFESCGKCTACREGIQRMYELLDYMTRGYGEQGDIEKLIELGEAVKAGALCGLGQTAPNPVLTTIRYFRDEYEAHINKTCPAGVCKALITFYIEPEKCPGCGLCARYCTEKCITGQKSEPYSIDEDKCIRCGICREVCKFDAVLVK